MQILPLQGSLSLDLVRYVVKKSDNWKVIPIPEHFSMTTNVIERENQTMKKSLGHRLLPIPVLIAKLCELYGSSSSLLLADWFLV